MERGYQHNFSQKTGAMYDVTAREKKAQTMVSVLKDYYQSHLKELRVLDVGASTGIIDNYLADFFISVVGLDIDQQAIEHARRTHIKPNLAFRIGDALNLEFPDNSFDVVICSQVYEHVPDPYKMMYEIFRVLSPGGVCYFAAGNRFNLNEAHYNLPLLSVIPRPLAHIYIRLTGKADHYYELHYTYWQLKRLVSHFKIHDYTRKIIFDPVSYHAEYMIQPGTGKSSIAKFISSNLMWLCPSYVWILEKHF